MTPSLDSADTARRCLQPRDDLRFLELDDGALIYDTIGRKVYALNNWATVGWLACNGKRSAPEIAETIAPRDQGLRTTILQALETFCREGLVHEVQDSHADHSAL